MANIQMNILQRTNLRLANGLNFESASLRTVEDPKDLSLTVNIELKGSSQVLETVRAQLRSNGQTSEFLNGVDGTVGGRNLIQNILTRMTDTPEATFPSDWDLDAEVRETWPRKQGIVSLSITPSRDPDAFAEMLGRVGIHHKSAK